MTFTDLLAGLRTLFRKQRVETELDDEVREYLEAAAADKIKSGSAREVAMRLPSPRRLLLRSVSEQTLQSSAS